MYPNNANETSGPGHQKYISGRSSPKHDHRALIHYPGSNTTTELNLRTQMQALKDMQAATHKKHPEYLIYGQNHYNAVWYNTKIKTKGNNKIKRKKINK